MQASDDSDHIRFRIRTLGGLFESHADPLPVYLVVSAPRFPAWLLKLPGAPILSSINTTHWGLRVAGSYYDLKMRGLYRTKPDVAYAVTLQERDERPSSKSIFIGYSHVLNEDIALIAKHMIKHSKWYHFWLDNCQTFITSLAYRVICPICSSKECHFAHTPEFLAILKLQDMRPQEFIFVTGNIVVFLLRAAFLGSLSLRDGLDIPSGTLQYVAWAAMISLSSFAKSQIKRESIEKENLEGAYGIDFEAFINYNVSNAWSDDIGVNDSRTSLADDPRETRSDAGWTNCEADSKDSKITYNISAPDIKDLPRRDLDTMTGTIWLLVFLMHPIGVYYNNLLTPRLFWTMFLSTYYLFFISMQSYVELSSEFPFLRPGRNGRVEVHGLCRVCQDIAKSCLWKNARCSREQCGTSDPDFDQREAPFWRQQWSTNDTEYVALRTLLCGIVYMSTQHLPALEQLEVQSLVQFALNPFSPVTPWGIGIRTCIYYIFMKGFTLYKIVATIFIAVRAI